MATLFARVLEASWQASLLVGLILLIQWTLHRRLSPGWRCAMWTLVLARLVMPALPESRFSLFGFLFPPAPQPALPTPYTTITYGVILDQTSAAVPDTTSKSLAPSRKINWHTILAAIWSIGAAIVLIRLTVTNALFVRALRRIPESTNPFLLELTHECCRALHLHKSPRIVETDLVTVPALAGVFHPTILLPPGITENLTREQLRFILLHELVHLKRRDLLIGWLVAVLNAIHWFNPVLWFAAARFRADRELACDARVLAVLHERDRAAYGHTILRLVENLTVPVRLAGTVAMVEGRSSLKRRIAAIAKPVFGGWRWSILLALILIAVAWMTLTRPKASAPIIAIDASDPTTRVYDIRDVIVKIQDVNQEHETERDEHGWPIMRPTSRPKPSREQLVAQVIELIQDTVASESWADRGGTIGSIREDGGQLIITQSPEIHRQLQRLFEHLRDARAIQISVETRFMAGESLLEELKRVVPENQQVTERFQPIFLSDDQAQALFTSIQKSKDSTTLAAPRITLFNGQRSYVTIATETAYAGDFIPKGDNQFDPVVKTIHSGLVLDCQATASADRKYVTLTLRPHLARLHTLEPRRWDGAPPDRNDLWIQVPSQDKITYSMTLSVPDGGWVVLPPDLDSIFDRNYHPLMMVRPTIIIQRDVDPATMPRLN